MCWKQDRSKLKSAKANGFWSIIRDEVNKHSPNKTLKKWKGKICNLTIIIKKLKKTTRKVELRLHFIHFMRTSTKFSQRDIINIPGFAEVRVPLLKEEEDVSLGIEQSFTDKSSTYVNETPLGKDLII